MQNETSQWNSSSLHERAELMQMVLNLQLCVNLMTLALDNMCTKMRVYELVLRILRYYYYYSALLST